MKTISMTEFRREPGERILDVVRDGATFLLTKQGKPVAVLAPVGAVDVDTVINPDGTIDGPLPLTMGRRL